MTKPENVLIGCFLWLVFITLASAAFVDDGVISIYSMIVVVITGIIISPFLK